jgi:hypothetical protein
VKVEFTHPLDSHSLSPGSSNPDEPGDIGEFSKLPNGDDLEVGEMAAPHLNGKVTPYEEVWRTVDLESSPSPDDGVSHGAKEWVLEGASGVERDGEMVFFARIRGYFIALKRNTERGGTGEADVYTYSALREDFDDVAGRWKRVYAVGNVGGLMSMSEPALSSGDVISPKKWTVGDGIVVGNGQCYVVRAVEY